MTIYAAINTPRRHVLRVRVRVRVRRDQADGRGENSVVLVRTLQQRACIGGRSVCAAMAPRACQ
jgi:hypothetical protein